MMRNSSMWENKSCPGSVPTQIYVSRGINGYLGHTTSMRCCVVVSARWLLACRGQVQQIFPSVLSNAFSKIMCAHLPGFGLEFVPAGSQLRRFQTRFLQWGRRLLAWPRGSPGVVVQGQLGWHDVVTVHLTQAAGLCARLLSLPPHCCAVRIAQYACTQSQSWIQLSWMNCTIMVSRIQMMQGSIWDAHHPPFVAGCVMSSLLWAVMLTPGMLQLCRPLAHLRVLAAMSPIAQDGVWTHVAARNARHWGFARCGHHNFADGRSARHRNQHTVPTHILCRFCANASDSLAHALLECTAHNVLRQRWRSRSRHFLFFFVLGTFLRLRHERRSGAHSGMLQCGPSLLSGALACLQGWGAASARQQRLRSARALPLQHCTSRREGAPGVRRRRRCVPRPLEGRTTELPTRTVQRTA